MLNYSVTVCRSDRVPPFGPPVPPQDFGPFGPEYANGDPVALVSTPNKRTGLAKVSRSISLCEVIASVTKSITWQVFYEWLLCKCISAENAVRSSCKFIDLATRNRNDYFKGTDNCLIIPGGGHMFSFHTRL